MNYWLADNREQAEKATLHQLIGRLMAMDKADIPVTANSLLEYIERTTADEEQRLNEAFPDKARKAETALIGPSTGTAPPVLMMAGQKGNSMAIDTNLYLSEVKKALAEGIQTADYFNKLALSFGVITTEQYSEAARLIANALLALI